MKKTLTVIAAAIFLAPVICVAGIPSQAQLRQWAQSNDFANLSIELAHEKQSQAKAQLAREEQYAKAAAVEEQQLRCNLLASGCTGADAANGPSPNQIRASADTAYANAQETEFPHIGILQAWVDKYTGAQPMVVASAPPPPPVASEPSFSSSPSPSPSPPVITAASVPLFLGHWHGEQQCSWGDGAFNFIIEQTSDGPAVTNMTGSARRGAFDGLSINGNSIRWTNWSGSTTYTGTLVSPGKLEGKYQRSFASDCSWTATSARED